MCRNSERSTSPRQSRLNDSPHRPASPRRSAVVDGSQSPRLCNLTQDRCHALHAMSQHGRITLFWVGGCGAAHTSGGRSAVRGSSGAKKWEKSTESFAGFSSGNRIGNGGQCPMSFRCRSPNTAAAKALKPTTLLTSPPFPTALLVRAGDETPPSSLKRT
jgi:hypothetical protein